MRKIEFETSLGVVLGTITNKTKVYGDFGERFIVEIDDDTVDYLDMFQWKSVFIYNDRYCKIELYENDYGYPEYKYRIIKKDINILEEMESAWMDCGDYVLDLKSN